MPANVTLDNYLKMECKETTADGLLQLVDTILPNPVICYHTCKGNLYNALKRQALYVQKPEKDFVEKFNEWSDKVWEVEIKPILEDFKYSYAKWFNGLTRSQQKEVMPYHEGKEVPMKNDFNMFCKLEKQEVTLKDGSWEWPKNRCICAPESYIKWVTGPVISALQELYAENNVKGYCVDKNWDDLGNFYNKCLKKGYLMTIQGDISGLDRSVTDFLLGINRLSYRFIRDKIYHCDPKLWDHFLMNNTTKIISKMFGKQGKLKFKGIQDIINLGNVWLEGTRKSGEYPTTHGNTELVSRLIRYVMEVVLNYDKDSYEMLVKGDDFVIFVVPTDHETIRNAFKEVFETRGIKADGKTVYKSGTALKFLKFGTIFDTDFCSTDTFYCKDCKTHRVTRKLNRYYTLTPFTRNVFGLSSNEIDNYKNALYTSDKKWSSNLELFTCFGERFKAPLHKIKIKKGKSKMIIPLEEGFVEDNNNYKLEEFGKQFGINQVKTAIKDHYYTWSLHPKTPPKECCNKWHKKICSIKYGWTSDEVELIIKNINEYKDVSDILLRGFDYNDKIYQAKYEFYYDQL